ncbi:MAG: UDP-N-acetylmuramate--L-alanine ligase [Phycisphaerales bacterium]|nr:UDP-N-acetylmuramate--L-alanine ligase [Phycisphaerales bacterium]
MSQLRTDSRSASRFTGRRVHFIGIGGCGMSGLARMLLDAGAIVSGSEPKPNAQTFELTRLGAAISRDQLGQLLSRETDLVVRTAAIPDNNPEFLAAKSYGLKSIKYAELLGQIMQERFGIAIAGTHGKSTTTAMLAWALMQCGADPSFVIGGTVPQLGGGSHSGSSRFFVAEACEFDRSFHKLHPTVAIITNIEEDHLDCYKDIDQIVESFRQFAQLVPSDGLIISNQSDERVRQALAGISAPIEFCSIGESDLLSGNGGQCPPYEPTTTPSRVGTAHLSNWHTRITGITKGCYNGEVFHHGKLVCELHLSVAGRHNLFNATMALAACHACGVDLNRAAEAIGRFCGVDRRMTEMGQVNGATIVDDYGHHPTEIRATLKAVREKYQPNRLWCIFQPHQHSRTRFLLEDFAASFALADETIVPDIYFVRDSESERQSVSSADLVARIAANGRNARHLPEFSEIIRHVRQNARPGDLILTLGAGNVWEIGRDLAAG